VTKILSTISGQFTRTLIFGAFFPAAVFVILNIILILPLLPSGLSPIERLADFDEQWQAAIALFVAIVVSGILYNLNILLIRLYEGYLFEDSWLGRRMRRKQAKKLAQVDEEIRQLRDKYERTSSEDDGYDEVARKLTLLWSERQVQFPPGEEFVTPTELGNVIAAFEHYARQQYGIDSVALWPRLVAEIDATYAGVIDDAKTSFDFFINSSFLSVVLALEYLYFGLYFQTPFSSVSGILSFLGIIAVLAGLSWLFYRFSIDSAMGWGDNVKAAFDLYRCDLLAKLGYETALTNAEEFDLWQRISQGMLFWSPDAPPPPYKKPALAVTRVEPSDIEWSITKGVEEPTHSAEQAAVPAGMKYVLTVKNMTAKSAENATLIDAVPSGFDYIVGSAERHKNGQTEAIEAAGTNPYRWELGDVDPAQNVTVTYRVVLRREAGKASS
jgi:uncharacterized repeat protein (TIGR01451 family)